MNIDLELPFHSDPPEPEQRIDATRYPEFTRIDIATKNHDSRRYEIVTRDLICLCLSPGI